MDLNPRIRKGLPALRSRRERIYKRTAEANVTCFGKGGARERADDAFYAYGMKKRRSKADFAPTWWRRGESNPRPKIV